MEYVYKDEDCGKYLFKGNGIVLSIMIKNYPDMKKEVNSYMLNPEFSIEDKMEFIRLLGCDIEQYCNLPAFIIGEKRKKEEKMEEVSAKGYFEKIISKLDALLGGRIK